MFKLACPCLFGTEAVVARELFELGYTDAASTTGRVTFTGDYEAIARANINLRCAERVLILLDEFNAVSFEELFQGVKALPWEEWIGKDDEFPVKGYSLNSQLHSVPDCQAIVKKAVVERLKQKYEVTWFQENKAKRQIQFGVNKDLVSIMIDTSGEGLHKRGYRQNSNDAPIKETLAAAILKLARYRSEKAFFDPLCGSGTFLIEAAMMGKNLAPGLNRRFSAEKWDVIPQSAWINARAEALDNRKSEVFLVKGYDSSSSAIDLTIQNAKKAGVGDIVKAEIQDISKFKQDEERAIVACNPPYGERMLDIKEAEKIYQQMGSVFYNRKGWSYFVISPHENFEGLFGRNADKKRKLYNGMIKCNLFQYFK
jgi:putative N6-adenine-specific DNA methylase